MINLYEALKKGTEIYKGMSVQLPLAKEASIYGIVAYNHFIDKCPPLGEANVVSNRILFLFGKELCRLPIFDSVKRIDNEKYPIYHLFIPQMFDLEYDSHKKAYLSAFWNSKLDPNITKIDNIKIIEGSAYYLSREPELYFSSYSVYGSSINGLSKSFVIITRRISPEKGTFVYEVFDPQEVEIITDNNEKRM